MIMARNLRAISFMALQNNRNSIMSHHRQCTLRVMTWWRGGVQTVKGLLKKAQHSGGDFQLPLLAYRTTLQETTVYPLQVADGKATEDNPSGDECATGPGCGEFPTSPTAGWPSNTTTKEEL